MRAPEVERPATTTTSVRSRSGAAAGEPHPAPGQFPIVCAASISVESARVECQEFRMQPSDARSTASPAGQSVALRPPHCLRAPTPLRGARTWSVSHACGGSLEFATPNPRRPCERRRSMKSRIRLGVSCLAILLAAVASRSEAGRRPAPAPVAPPPPCFVRLAGFGPIDPVHGFPMYYQDSTALALQPCLDAVCGGPGFALPNPALPLSFPDNFPVEVFYSRAISKMTVGTVSALYVGALEGSFANGNVALPGDQVVFSRIRVRVFGVTPGGTYTVTHPYGVDVLQADALGTVNFTQDSPRIPVGLGGAALAFGTPITAGRVGPFLRFATGPVPPPPGTIGNPASPQTVTGSNCGQNLFRVVGPGLPAGGISTNLFSTIIGKVAQTCGNGIVDLGEQCDDGNTLNGDCCSATCKFEPAGSPCPNPNPNACISTTCNGAAGCVATPNMALCNDGNACTTADVCTAGVCVGGPALGCNDGNVCTDDSCDPAIGCVHTPVSVPCNDGNPCTSADTCAAGACVGSPIAGCTCTPTTCAAQGKNCGTILDGCGGTLACGTCAAPQICGGGGIANVCGPKLTLTATGRAGETVSSTPAGLSVPVGTTGSAPFAPGTRITLSVTNGRSATWSGACSSGATRTPTRTFTLNAAASETASVQ